MKHSYYLPVICAEGGRETGDICGGNEALVVALVLEYCIPETSQIWATLQTTLSQ